MSGETAAERWSPIQRVESVLLSIISLLDDAECSSPANVDAGVMLRKDPEGYKMLVKRDVELSKADIPPGFIMPDTHLPSQTPQVEKQDDRDFWYDSDQDNDFGGSDTDAEMTQDEEEEEEDEEEAEEEEEDEEEERPEHEDEHEG